MLHRVYMPTVPIYPMTLNMENQAFKSYSQGEPSNFLALAGLC